MLWKVRNVSFRKILHAFYSCNHRFDNRPFALLLPISEYRFHGGWIKDNEVRINTKFLPRENKFSLERKFYYVWNFYWGKAVSDNNKKDIVYHCHYYRSHYKNIWCKKYLQQNIALFYSKQWWNGIVLRLCCYSFCSPSVIFQPFNCIVSRPCREDLPWEKPNF